MENISVGGLVSGLDTNKIVEQLTEVEYQRVRRVQEKRELVETKLKSFDQLKGKVGEFASKSKELSKEDSFNVYSMTSSDEDAVSITGEENANPGTYKVEVANLATNWKVTSKSYSGIAATLGLNGKFEVSKSKEAIEKDPINKKVEIQISSSDTLKDVVNKVNSTEGIGVRASILSLGQNDYRLVLAGIDEGSEGFYLKDTGATNVLDGTGLGILNSQSKIQSDFNFRLNSVGPADTSTLLSDLYTGIGANSAVNPGDTIAIDGVDAQGNTVSGTFNIGAGSTVGDILAEVKNVYQSAGATVDVGLNSSGEIVIKDTSGGVLDMQFKMSFNDVNASGSTMQLSPAGKKGIVKNDFQNVLSEGKKAFYRLDGLSVAAESNTDDKTVTGTTFHLHKAELGREIEVSLSRDNDGIQKKIQEFIDSYNQIVKYIDEKSKVEIKKPTNPNEKEEIVSRGEFASDSGVQRIKYELRDMITKPIQELASKSKYSSASSIGITSNSATGFLEIDQEKFKKALNQDFEGVRRLFQTTGFSDNPNHELGRYDKNTETGVYQVDADGNLIDSDKSTGNVLEAANRSGDVLTSMKGASKGLTLKAPLGSGTGNFSFVRGIAGQIDRYYQLANDRFEGLFSQTKEAMDKRLKAFDEQVSTLERKVTDYRTRLVRQFTDLETSMSRLQQQSASFQAQMSAL